MNSTPSLVLYAFGGAQDDVGCVPSCDPFCLAAEVLLHVAGVPFTIQDTNDPAAVDGARLPALHDTATDTMVYDPRSIIEHCRTLNIGRDLDASLSVEQCADARAIGALVESGLHDVALLVQWNIAANNRITRKHYANAMPLRSRWSHVYGDGMARWVHERTHRFLKAVSLPTATSGVHQPISVDDIATLPLGGARDDAPDAAFDARWDMEKALDEAREAYRSLTVFLKTGPFFFGSTTTTSTDCIMFAHLALHLDACPKLAQNPLGDLLRAEFPELCAFVQRFREHSVPDNFAEIHARKRPLPTLRERMRCISARQVFQHSVKSARSFFFSARYTLARMLDQPTLLLQDQSHHRETPTSTTSAAEDVKDPTVSELERKLAANRTLSVVSAVAAFSLYVWYRGLLLGIFGRNDEEDDDAEYYYGDEEEEEEDGIRGRASDLLKEENEEEEEEEEDEDAAFTEQEDADFDGVSA